MGMVQRQIGPERLQLLFKPLLPGKELVCAALDLPGELQAIRCWAGEVGLHMNATAENHGQGQQHGGDQDLSLIHI